MKSFYFFFCFILLLGISSCDKENHRRIKYRVVSKSSFDILYSVNGKTFTKTGEAGEWQSSYRMKVGSEFFLSAIKTSPGFELSILVYTEGVLIGREDTDDMWDLIKLHGIVY